LHNSPKPAAAIKPGNVRIEIPLDNLPFTLNNLLLLFSLMGLINSIY